MLLVPSVSVLHVPYASPLYLQKTRAEPGYWWGLRIQAQPIASSEAEIVAMENTHLIMTHKAYDEKQEAIEIKDSIFEENKDDPETFMDPIIKCWPWKTKRI